LARRSERERIWDRDEVDRRSGDCPLTAPLVAAKMQGDGGISQAQDIYAQFPKACDQAEDACEKKHHRECAYHYPAIMEAVSPIHPDADDFKCHPVGNECKNAGCHDEGNGNGNGNARPQSVS
jgi:hypothetical protein